MSEGFRNSHSMCEKRDEADVDGMNDDVIERE